jgi:flagellar hook-associated protein 3 FlgL
MRVTENSIIGDFLRGITRTRERLSQLQLQLGTQKNILSVSDDPGGTASLMRYSSRLDRTDRYLNAVTIARSSLRVSGDSLNQTAGLIQQVKGIVEGAGNTSDPALLHTFADQVDQILGMTLDVANTTFDGRYLFGGTKTTTPPFSLTGTPQRAVFSGNTEDIVYSLGEGVSQAGNVNGLRAFGSVAELTLSGTLDAGAALGTATVVPATITDGLGTGHDLELVFEKTAANTWSVTARMPSGAADATVTNGRAVVTFDPAAGTPDTLVTESGFTLTPVSTSPGGPAPAVKINLRAGGLQQSAGSSSPDATSRLFTVFDKMIEIRDGLRAGAVPAPEDFETLSLFQSSASEEEARAGSRSQLLDNAEQYLIQQRERLLDLKSGIQDIDAAEIGLRLTYEEVMLEAALSAAARIIPRSLVDFLT